jgi:uncharacterized Ntn-hydrolase superfamily protein
MTFSIVVRDPSSGDLAVAVASKFLAVGSVVPWAEAGVGAIATQSYANVRYGPDGLDALRSGIAAPDVLDALVAGDDLRSERQAGVVDAEGRAATWTGDGCMPWAGGRIAEGCAVQGNILTGPEVVDAMLGTYRSSDAGSLAERALAALLAGDRAGGDARGRQSAALLVVRDGGGYAGGNDRLIDLRADDHPDPVPELGRLLATWRLLMERPAVEDLVPIDDVLAEELHERLTGLGWAPGRDDALAASVRSAMGGQPRVGTPRPATERWDAAWDGALLGWMGVANLEERAAAPGWIDPQVLAVLRDA